MKDTYTRLLEVAAESKDQKVAEEAVIKLVHHLRSVGRLKMLPSIASELRLIEARRKALRPTVEVARKEDAEYGLKEAKAHGIETKEAIVNTSLISGWRGSYKGMLVDRTGKRSLIDIYKNVTS